MSEVVAPVDFEALAGQVRAAPPRCGTVRVVAVDGGAASGKSTFAATLAAALGNAPVLACDDLLDGWADQFTFWPRLRAILAALAADEPARFRRYDWVAGRFGPLVTLEPPPVLVVEGVSAIAACGPAAALTVFLDVPRQMRERRWLERDGAAWQPEWQAWLDAEDRFFTERPPVADLVVRFSR